MLIPSLLLAPILLAPAPAQVGRIDGILNRRELSGATVALVVRDVETGETLVSRRAEEPLAPASNMKLLTTAAAIDLLGPEWDFETRLVSDRRPGPDGTLDGDLIVQGGGDPCLRADLLAGQDETEPARVLVGLLEAAGVRRVAGRLLLDDGLLDRQWVHPDWTDGDVASAYAAPIGALSMHGNVLRLGVSGGVQPSAQLLTFTEGYRLRDELRIADKSNAFMVGALRPDADGLVVVRGEIGRGISQREIGVPVVDPTELFGRCLEAALREAGVEVLGGVHALPGAAADLPDPVVLARLETPIENALVVANKESDNSVADHLFKVLGARVAGDGSFEGGGLAVRRFLTGSVRTSPQGLELRDGSGLSAENRVTAEALVATLVAMARAPAPVRDPWLRSLPISGLDGSLDGRLTEPPYAGAVRAKTGYIGGVSTLSGYARTTGGRTLAFSILINGFRSQYGNTGMKKVQDDLCRVLVDLP